MAEFEQPEDLIEATRGAYERGYRMMEAYTPFPVEGLAEALGFSSQPGPADRVPGRPARRAHGLLHAVVLGGDRLPDQRGRPAAP